MKKEIKHGTCFNFSLASGFLISGLLLFTYGVDVFGHIFYYDLLRVEHKNNIEGLFFGLSLDVFLGLKAAL